MKLNDAIWGGLSVLLAAALLLHVRTFPTIPGQQYGPALFPGVIAVGLLICGVGLILKGVASRDAHGAERRWMVFDPWTRSRPQLVRLTAVVAVNLLYVFFSDRLGFIVTGIIYLGVLFVAFRVRKRWIVPLAVGLTLLIHYAFYRLLRVPLPWGLLQGVAW